MNVVKDVKHSGLIVDARGEKLLIQEHPSIGRGSIVVVGLNKVQHFDSTKTTTDFLKALKSLIVQ